MSGIIEDVTRVIADLHRKSARPSATAMDACPASCMAITSSAAGIAPSHLETAAPSKEGKKERGGLFVDAVCPPGRRRPGRGLCAVFCAVTCAVDRPAAEGMHKSTGACLPLK